MQTQEHQFNELDIRAVLLLKKRVVDEKDIQTYVNEISTYVNSLNYLYIYNMTNQDLTDFYKALKKFNNISYATVEDYGEVVEQYAYQKAQLDTLKRYVCKNSYVGRDMILKLMGWDEDGEH